MRDGATLVAAWLGLVMGVAQIVVAAAMVLALFPGALRAAHLAAGASLVAWLVARPSDSGYSGSRRAVKCRRWAGSSTMRSPFRLSRRSATVVATSRT